MTLTASSYSRKTGAGRKRKAKIPKFDPDSKTYQVGMQTAAVHEQTELEHKRLFEVCLLDKAGFRKKQIAEKLNMSVHLVNNYIKKQKKFYPHLNDVDVYRTSKAKLIDATESYALQSMSKALGSESVNLRDATLAFKTLHQAGRLESNQSTANVNNHVQFSGTPLSKTKDS